MEENIADKLGGILEECNIKYEVWPDILVLIFLSFISQNGGKYTPHN